MNSTEKPHQNADSSVNSVLHRLSVFRISKPLLSKFITASRNTLKLTTTREPAVCRWAPGRSIKPAKGRGQASATRKIVPVSKRRVLAGPHGSQSGEEATG